MRKLCIKEVFRSAWQQLNGAKGPIWLITLVALIPLLLTQIILLNAGIAFYHETPPLIWTELVMPIISNFILGIFMAGMIMPAIKRARGEMIDLKTGFGYFRRAPQMMTLMLITGTISSLLMYGSTLVNVNHGLAPLDLSVWRVAAFLLSSLVFLLCYIAVALIADAKFTAFEAIFISVKKTAPQIHKIILLVLLYFACFLLAATPMLLGALLHSLGKSSAANIVILAGAPIFAFCMAWLLPFNALLQANVYLRLTRPE